MPSRNRLPEIIICPASGTAALAHIATTVAAGIPWSALAPVVSGSTSDVLEPVAEPNGDLRFWGFRDNSRIKRNTLEKPPQSWDRMPVGSLLIFTNRQNVSHTGVIGARLYDPSLATHLWGSDEFRWIVGLRDVQTIAGVSSADLREAADFGGVFMAHPVKPARRARVMSLLSDAGWSVSSASASSVASIESSTFDPDSPLSIRAEVERRVEQAWLRRQVIPGDDGDCDLCGTSVPAAFLRAAHIKPRFLCSDDERRESANVIVACVRCDVAFERGWLALDDNQNILVSGSRPMTADLAGHLNGLAGRHVSRPLKADSVAYHRRRRFSP